MDNDSQPRIGDFIRRKRQEQGLSLRDVAERAGISKSWLSDIENGRRELPTLPMMRRIARGLAIDEAELLEATGHLPDVATYLRTKLDLPEPAVEQLEEFVRFVTERERRGGGDADNSNDQRAA